MKYHLILACAIAFGCVIPGKALAVQEIARGADTPLYEHTSLTRLANGLTVLVKRDRRFPAVSTRLYVRAGSAIEESGQAGISHMLEHMVFKGTSKYPKGAISAMLEGAGAYLNAATSFDYTVYLNDLPSSQWRKGLDAVAEMALRPTLDAKELASEKDVVIAELKRGRDNPYSLLFQKVQAKALKGSKYERPIIGFEDTVRKLTPDDMRSYIRELYQPQNMLLVVAGDVDGSAVLAEADRLFGKEQNRGRLTAKLPLDPASFRPGGVTVTEGPWNKVYFALGIPVPGGCDSRSVALDALAGVLGGDETSLFVRRYRNELKLVDSISVGNASFAQVGLLLVTAEMEAKNAEAFWKELIKDLKSLPIRRVTDAALSRVKVNTEEEMVRKRETIAGMASHLGYCEFMIGGEQGELNMLEAIRNIGREALRDAAAQWVAPRRVTAEWLVPQGAGMSAAALENVMNDVWPCPKGAAADTVVATGKPEVIDLGHGRRLVLTEDRTMPRFAATLTFAGGEMLTSETEQGLAALTARSLLTGTSHMDRQTFEDTIADMAGGVSATSGTTRFSVNISGPSRFSPRLFSLLGDVICKPAFKASEVDLEKQAQLADIKSSEDRPLGLLFSKLPPFLFPGSAFGHMPNGSPEAVKGYDSKRCRDFWSRQRECPWVLSVTGRFDRNSVMELAKSLPVPKEKRAVPAPAWNTVRNLDLRLASRNQAHLLLIYPTVANTHEDTAALELLEKSLGGMGGPLFTEMRDKRGLGYTVSVFNAQNSHTGYLAFYIATDPSRLAEAEMAFGDIIAGLGKKVLPASELRRGIMQWEGDELRSSQALANRSTRAAGLAIENKDLDYPVRLIEKAKMLTQEDLITVAGRYLDSERKYRVVVLP